MKSQTKIIIAALVAAVVAFSAVGATYAWFSDTEKTDVSVSTGTVNVSYEASDLKMYSYDKNSSATDKMEEVTGTFACGGTATLTGSGSSYTISVVNAAPGDKITFVLTAYTESSLNIQYRGLVKVTGEQGDLTIDGGTSDWTSAGGVTAKTQLCKNTITIAIPIESKNAVNCEIEFILEAVQSNADPYTYISSVDQLYAFANDVNIKGNTYVGKTVKLCADLDLGGAEWTPITGVWDGGSYGNYTSFRGIFDGQDHTISNFTVSADENAGFFGVVGGEVKNLKIDKEMIVTTYNAGCVAASLYYGKITNCQVTNSSVTSVPALQDDGTYDNGNNVGGVVGLLNCGTVDFCTISKTTVTAYRSFGGIVGTGTGSENSKSTITKCTVADDVVLQQTLKHNYKNLGTAITDDLWGRIVSERSSYYTQSGNTPDNTVKTTKPTVIDTELVISTADELRAFAAEVNSGCTFVGKTVKLANDIDLKGAEWAPIMCPSTDAKKYPSGYAGFQGTFDGNDKIVSNFTVTDDLYAGFFGYVRGGTVKNLTIDNATVTGHKHAGGLIAVCQYTLDGSHNSVENCTVKNSIITSTTWIITEDGKTDWNDGNNVGGIIGYARETDVKSCTVNNTTITAYRDVAGIVGKAFAGTKATDICSIADCTIDSDVKVIQDLTHDYNSITQSDVPDTNWGNYSTTRYAWADGGNNTGAVNHSYTS